MRYTKWYRPLLLIGALILALSYYCLNRFAIEQANPTNIPREYLSLKNGGTIPSPDDEYYISPPENFLAGKGWRRSPPLGKGSFVRRTPVYSLWYLGHRVVGGLEKVNRLLIGSQILLYGLSALAFLSIVSRLLKSRGARIVCLLVYVVTPFFSSYSFFTLTEALSVPFIVFALAGAVQGHSTEKKSDKMTGYIAAGIFFGLAVLTRPFTGLVGITLALILWDDCIRKEGSFSLFIRRGIIMSVAPVVMLLTWTVRNYIVTGEIVILERYAHPESHDGFKPAFNAAWDLYVAAGVKQDEFYKFFPYLFSQVANHGNLRPDLVAGAVNTFPLPMQETLGQKRLHAAIEQYQQLIIKDYYPYISQGKKPLPSYYSSRELAVVDTFKILRGILLRTHPIMRIKSPLLVVKEMIFHSNTSHLAMFQPPFRDRIVLINILRYMFLVLHIGLYAGVSITIFRLLRSRKGWVWSIALIAPSVVLMCFLSIVIGTTEQRYLLIFLPLLLLNAGLLLDQLMLKRHKLSS
jgi:4-amino-4-deoxy-L-arabinose transferase-like glycosyltransferase